MPDVITYSGTLTVIECGACNLPFAIPEDMLRRLRQTGERFYCPRGCGISYGSSENARLKRRLESAEARATHARDQAQAAEYRTRAYKGQVTRIKRRVANGVCPCCQRTFADLARHMAGQHPDFETTT